MASREAFLNEVREAVARGRMHPVALDPRATAAASYIGGGSDPAGKLLEEWCAVGGQGARVAGSGQARDYLAAFIARHQVKSAIYWSHPLLERLQLSQLLAQAGARAVCWWPQAPQAPDAARDAALTAEWGITSVNWAVAETGTLALGARAQQGRLVSLLPPKYLAIVEAAQILPDLFDLFAALEPARHDLPSNLALVTGPSKTGDIELKLTTGVHGPGEVHLLVIDPEPCLP